eukprot:1816612-Amphidinium_carterae.1
MTRCFLEAITLKLEHFAHLSLCNICVTPPYEDFYLDGCPIPPFNKGFAGYEGLSMDYKGPM